MVNFTELTLQKRVTYFIITMTLTPNVPGYLLAGSKAGAKLDIGRLKELKDNYGNLHY